MGWFANLVYSAPLWLIGLALVLAMMLGREAGALGHRLLAPWSQRDADSQNDEGYLVSAVLGLLALLIAFTFGLALDRYEARRHLVVVEANALGTAYLRADLLDAPDRLRIAIRAYTEQRLAYGESAGEAQQDAEAKALTTQAALWREAMTQLTPARTTPLVGQITGPLNEAIDAAAERKATLAARLPMAVVAALFGYAVVAAAILGYAVASAGGRHRIASLIAFALIATALTLILDLDRPRSGAIHVTQAPIREALQAMTSAAGR